MQIILEVTVEYKWPKKSSRGKHRPTTFVNALTLAPRYNSDFENLGDLNVRNFTKQMGRRTGKPNILNTLTIAGECSANNPRYIVILNFVYF